MLTMTPLDSDRYLYRVNDNGDEYIMDRCGGQHRPCAQCEQIVPESELDDCGWCNECCGLLADECMECGEPLSSRNAANGRDDVCLDCETRIRREARAKGEIEFWADLARKLYR